MPAAKEFLPINIAVLTVSDTRTPETDTSGDCLVDLLSARGHHLADRAIVRDDIYAIRAITSQWIADEGVEAIVVTGGTGFSGRDSTPEAMIPLFDKTMEGFGELFRQISYAEIGTSTIQSRALGGLANNTAIFCVPGSTNACRTAWQGLIDQQLDATFRPCNFVALITAHRNAAEECGSRG
ncbi:MAG: molybdenum cofactor biosynthesis protein B [Pseudomonadales bacterium]|nr:molybdenum cofactor biosynthesis protein B [Pseudomonadales bacterium]